MRIAALVPAFEAQDTLAEVVAALDREANLRGVELPILVVDDGSSDGSAEVARRAGAKVLRHERNRGKGAALRTGLRQLAELGFDAAVTVDADAQHPADEALNVALHPAPTAALVLGVRDLVRAAAPRANQRSNAISNFFLSRFAGRPLRDTQCGLRRYPVQATLDLDCQGDGYAFEAEALLRAARAGWEIAELDVRVIYPPAGERRTHFHSVRDPTRIVLRVIQTLLTTPRRR